MAMGRKKAWRHRAASVFTVAQTTKVFELQPLSWRIGIAGQQSFHVAGDDIDLSTEPSPAEATLEKAGVTATPTHRMSRKTG